MEHYNLFVLMLYIRWLARVLFLVGASGLLLWFAFRRLPRGWRRFGLVAFIALFWIVDLVPGAVGFPSLCRREAGIRVSAPVPGRPDIVVGEQIPSGIAARALHLAGRVEYELVPGRARRLDLRPGLYRFEPIENAPSDCAFAVFRNSVMLAMCATAVQIETPDARYRFDMSGPVDGEAAAAGPWDLSWWAEKHHATVVDRTTGETLATATLLIRRRIPSVSGLISYKPADAACPKGATPEGLPILLFPVAFPDLGGRSR